MLVAVIEDQALSFLPGPDVVSHSDPADALWLRDHQSEVVAKYTFVRPSVWGNVLPGGQN